MTIPTISFPPSNLKSDLSVVEVALELSFPLPAVELEAESDPDPELQFLTNLLLVGAEDTGAPWASIAGEVSGEAESPVIFLPNFILGMKREVGTEKPAEAFGVGSTAVGVGVGRFPGVGVAGESEITS
jgi:hypothetical protein